MQNAKCDLRSGNPISVPSTGEQTRLAAQKKSTNTTTGMMMITNHDCNDDGDGQQSWSKIQNSLGSPFQPYKSTLFPSLQLSNFLVKHQISLPHACPVSKSSKHQLVSKLLQQGGENGFLRLHKEDCYFIQNSFFSVGRHFQSIGKIHSNPHFKFKYEGDCMCKNCNSRVPYPQLEDCSTQ